MAAVAHLEQNVAALQNALVVAMEEVDQLRSQFFAETGKLHREFREVVDATASPAATTHHVQRLFESPRRLGSADNSKLEYLELAVRALQERRDATPAAVDALMHQMKRWTENADASARQLEHRMVDNIASSEQKMRSWTEERLREADASMRRTINGRLDQQDASLREQEGKLGALTTLVSNLDKRLHAAEEGLSQLDAEQHEVTTALQSLREQQRAAIRSPNRRAPVEDLDNIITEHSAVLREEVLSAVDNKISQQQRRASPPLASAATSALEQRAVHQEIQNLRQDVARCVSHIERLMDEHQRLSQSHHTCVQSVQRVEQVVDGVRDRLELDLKTELQRFDTLQKTFFSRQEQILNSERHQLGVKVAADLQRMHQRQMEELQKSEFRRFDDIRNAQNTLREEFGAFVERQREDQGAMSVGLDERLRRAAEELKTFVHQEVAQQTDLAKKGTTNANEELRKVSSRAMDELKRVKQMMEDQSTRTTDQTKFLHTRVQQVLDAEVHRFDQIAFEFTAKLQKQVDDEVVRVVSASEGALGRELEAHKDISMRELKNIKEEVQSLRSSLQAIAAPSNALGSIDSRVDVLRRDVLQLHEAVSRVHDLENRMQSNISQDTRVLVESLRGDVLRDVSSHIVRFDQALVELAQENASLRNRLAMQDAEATVSYTGYPMSSQHQQATELDNSSAAAATRRQPSSKDRDHFRLATMPVGVHNGSRVSGASTPTPHSPSTNDYAAHRDGPSSVFGRASDQAPSDLVSSAPRGGGGPYASMGTHRGSTRGESPDRQYVVDRYSAPSSSSYQPPREDPLVGVFGEYQASP